PQGRALQRLSAPAPDVLTERATPRGVARSVVPSLLTVSGTGCPGSQRPVAHRRRRSASASLARSGTCCSGAGCEPVALAPQVREERFLVLGALGLDLEDDLDLVDREVRPGADVLDVHDVATLARDREEEVGEHPRPVGEEGPHLEVAAGG